MHAIYTQERTLLSCKAPLCPLNRFSQPPAVRWIFLVWFLVAVLRARPEVMAPSDQNMGWWHSGLKQWPGGASQALGGGAAHHSACLWAQGAYFSVLIIG